MLRGIKLTSYKNLIQSNVRDVIKPIRHFYDARTNNDTIFATATPLASVKGSPLAVIRVSGPLTNDLITRFTRLRTTTDERVSSTKSIEPRKAILTKIYAPNNALEVIDIGLIIWFPKPNSYTGEDVCEFHLHGSQAIMKHVLNQLGGIDGVRPAEPGEFTRRAVKNDKMSLVQAESLPDLIASKTDKQRKLALKGLEGSVVKKYELWLEELVKILAYLEASIDFGEDELIGEAQVVDECIAMLGNLSQTLATYIRQQTISSNYIRNGFKVAIMGRPNVGKSSLMNKLCRSERSIVSDICGTTRDVVEQSFELGGHSLSLCDTAGLRYTLDDSTQKKDIISDRELDMHRSIEQEGIRRALIEGSKADVIIYVIDVTQLSETGQGMRQLSGEIIGLVKKLEIEQELSQRFEGRQKLLLIIMNKIDIRDATLDKSLNLFDDLAHLVKIGLQPEEIGHNQTNYITNGVAISCKTGQNLESLVEKLSHQLDVIVSSDDSSSNCDFETLEFVNERHLAFLKSCQRNIFEAGQLNLATIDQMAQHVRDATDYLSRCLGTVSNEQVLDVIFRDFCIGK